MKLIFHSLILFTYLGRGLVMAQANTNGNPSILGTLQFTDCRTYPVSTLFELICPLPNQGGNVGFCDSHCRCIHKAKWGQCETRPQTPTVPVGTGWGDQWCRCKYDEPPKEFIRNPYDTMGCPLWQIIDPLCSLTQVNDTAGGCSSDCICAHGQKNGYCDKEQYCICTNEDTVDPSLTFGSYNPLSGLINQIIGG